MHRALGIAPDDRVLDVIDALADHDPGKAISLVESAMKTGVQPADLLSSALDFLRDVMVSSVGENVPLLTVAPSQTPRLRAIAKAWPLDSILAAMQILDQAKARLRGSSHGRLIVELALARAARLEDFAELGELVGRLTGSAEGGPPVKKKLTPAENGRHTPPPAPVEPRPKPVVVAPPEPPGPDPIPPIAPDLETVASAWEHRLPAKVGIRLGPKVIQFPALALEPPGILVVGVPPRYNVDADLCELPEHRRKIEATLSELVGTPLTLRFNRSASVPESPAISRTAAQNSAGEALATDPWVQGIKELFETVPNPVQVDFEDASAEP